MKNLICILFLLLIAPLLQAEEPLGSSVKLMIKQQSYNPNARAENRESVPNGMGERTEQIMEAQQKPKQQSKVNLRSLSGNQSR